MRVKVTTSRGIVKITILPKAIYRFSVIPIKITVAFCTEIEQINFQICVETKKTPNIQNNLMEEEKNWKNHMPCLQSRLQSYRNQNMWC